MYQNEKQVIDAIKEGKLSVREADAIARGFSPAAAMRIMQAFSGVENPGHNSHEERDRRAGL